MLTVVPAVPDVRSQARTVRPLATLPLAFKLGWKYTRSVGLNSKAAVSDTAGNAVHVPPLSVEKNQLPSVVLAAVIATPSSAPVSTSVWPPVNAETSVPTAPDGAAASSFRVIASTVSASTGASLTPLMVTLSVLDATRPWPSLMV